MGKNIKAVTVRSRKKLIAAVLGTALAVSAAVILLFPLTYKDVELQCQVKGNRTYIEMQSQAGYELWFTGTSDKDKSYLKVFGKKKIGNSETSKSSWEGEVDVEELYQYIFEFSDKIVTIENGKVVSEKDKK